LRFPLLSRNTATLARWTERQPVIGSRWGGATVVVIGAVALLGWMTGSRTLSAIGQDFIPMAPNTALLFILLGAGLCAPTKSRWALSYNRVAIALSFLFSASRVAEYLLGTNLGVDGWLFSFPSESLGLAPVGKMAFFTALTFVLACIALAGLTVPTRNRYLDDVIRTLGFVVTLVGIVFSLGYLYDAPLLYSGRHIPMALPSAVAFLILGLSIVIPAIVRDHTDRRDAERALRLAHDQLEHRVAERTAALEAVNAGLQRTVTQLEERTKEAELARQERYAAEERYHALVDGLAIGVVLMTPQGIQTANPSAERILGLSLDQMLGRTAVDPRWRAVHEDGSPFPGETHPVAVSLRTGESQRNVVMGLHRPDDSLVWIEINSDPLFRGADATPYAAVASFVDITQRKQAEDHLRQAQKMDAVGQLAGGIAHDFNNMLTAITGYSVLLLDELDPSDPKREDVQEIKAAADRAATLTRQLLAFSRRQMLQPEVIDLNKTVGEMEKMLRRLVVEDIKLVTVLEPELGRVKADPGQVEQVLMNLVVNARDAMPDGGTLTLETANVRLGEAYAGRHAPLAIPSGEYVRLTVSDTGCGMDDVTRARIFEPFFTTKPKGKGTGLGLSTVYGIVKQSGGYIWCYSEPGEGTTFKIYLPRTDAVAEQPNGDDARSTSRRGSETILLVEDDDAVRSISRRILELQGYSVIEAGNGVEALRLCGLAATPVDLVLTDMVMPEMNGKELARQLRERYPEIRLLFMSGYTEDAALRQSFLEPGTAFIEKPFAPAALADKVRRVLD
jgi:two-component system cell cycle sensor histidine kinase/response regulator CckA